MVRTLFVLSQHAENRARERGIKPKWIKLALTAPQKMEMSKQNPSLQMAWVKILEMEGQILKIGYKPGRKTSEIVTVYFDRTMRGQL